MVNRESTRERESERESKRERALGRRTGLDGAVPVQAAHRLDAGDIEGQAAAAVPAPGDGDAQRQPGLLLQAHRLLLAGEATRRVLGDGVNRGRTLQSTH